MSDNHIPGHEVTPVDELSIDSINERIDEINSRITMSGRSYITPISPNSLEGGRHIVQFLRLGGSDNVKQEAASEYIEHLKILAKKFHADGVDLLGFGGEALVFNLFRNGEPINAIIRMEAGYIHSGLYDVEIDSAGNEMHPEDTGPFIEEFSPADHYMPGVLPNYYRDITSVKHDINQRGVMFKVAPMVYTLGPIDNVRDIKDHEIAKIMANLTRRHIMGRLDTTELLEPNIGFYPLAAPTESNPNGYKLHAISIDPGNMQHGHNQNSSNKTTQARRIFWPTKFKELFAHDETADEQMREEVKEDAKRLMNGEESELSKRITNIQNADLSQSWADMVQTARSHKRVITPD